MEEGGRPVGVRHNAFAIRALRSMRCTPGRESAVKNGRGARGNGSVDGGTMEAKRQDRL